MLTIIVPARNDQALTARCLETVRRSLAKLDLSCQFVLVDDASEAGDRTTDVFLAFRNAAGAQHEVKIVRARTHQHYTGAFSIGLHLATGGDIFFLSNDMFVTPTFLRALMEVSALDPAFGIVRGTSNLTDGHHEHRVPAPPDLKDYQGIEAFSGSIYEAHGTNHVEDELLSGDAILIKRSLVDRIGVLDTRFFGYFGDIDYGMRAHIAGFKLVCAKGAWLYHVGAGHLMREGARRKLSEDQLLRMRMALVDAAYQELRKKWSLDLPAKYQRGQELKLFAMARANAGRAALKCELPKAILDDLDYY